MVLFLSNKRYCSKTLLFFIIGSLVYMSGYREYKYLYGLAKRAFLWRSIYRYDFRDWRGSSI